MAEAFGPYLVHEQIGLGGMASVHRAETRGIAGFSRAVALKRMLPHVAANEDLVRSFVREARLASHLRHANVAQTLDLGKVGDTYFIAMELVPGKNLREVLSHCLRVCGTMPLPIAINIIGQIADALDYAHNLCDETGTPLGIIHRDVSPANVIVSEGGVAKLIDFGIAKASAQSMQTMSRTIKGKFSYMAPEYLEGRIDLRADLFALGVIAHELLANKPLFQASDEMETLNRVATMKIDPPSCWSKNVPPEIDSIVMTALERDPSVRWQGAQALRTALTTEAQQLGLVAHGAQVDEWMTWAFQQKARELRADTMPEISISTSEESGEHTAEVAPAVIVHARPSSPTHPRTVPRKSAPPVTIPRDEFLDDQRTTLHRPRDGRDSRQPETVRTNTVPPDAALPDTVKTPVVPMVEELRPISTTLLGTAPAPLIPSGARTAQRPAVDAPAEVEDAGSAGSAAMTQVAPPTPRRRILLLGILLIVAAVASAAVVYFALPYLNMMKRRIALISTGGTIEKTYDELSGVLANQVSVLDVMLASLELRGLDVQRIALMNKDSLEMTADDHTLIAETAARMARQHAGVVVVHGTDRLAATGERIVELAGMPASPIVLTGAMRPYELRSTDALQNLTEALLAVQLLVPGVYVAMHNQVLQFPGVVKDCERGTFVKP